MLNKFLKIRQSLQNHKIQKKKKKKKEKTLIIFVSGLPSTNTRLDQRSKYIGTKLQMLWVCF